MAEEKREAQRDANHQLGLFSSHAVDATKNLFWSRFAAGKQFAKRMTLWDAVFVGMRSMGR